MSGIFTQSPANRRRYGVAVFVGIVAGIISAFVKWGAEHPFPPRSPIDFFAAACKVDITGLTQDQVLAVCSRAFLNPPHVFLRDYLGIDPTDAAFTFADHAFNWIGVTHMIFSLVFAVGYCLVAERLSKLGNTLSTVSNQYNSTVTALVGQQGLVGKVERFKTLSAKVNKTMPDVELLNNQLDLARLTTLEPGNE